MATDKLRIQGGGSGANIRTAGKDGSVPPARTATPVTEATSEPASGAVEPAVSPDSVSDTQTPDSETGKQLTLGNKQADITVSSTGRSRVIIRPKSNPAPAGNAADGDPENAEADIPGQDADTGVRSD